MARHITFTKETEIPIWYRNQTLPMSSLILIPLFECQNQHFLTFLASLAEDTGGTHFGVRGDTQGFNLEAMLRFPF